MDSKDFCVPLAFIDARYLKVLRATENRPFLV